ncbi:class I SAM-dependent methyltransferase [Xanthomonas sp. 3307]|uniref:class I SAM-dependent methyltransferase n=1 Tax=Xanthomonas sp. 3307 TaxID=3035316 RepID=UPI00160B9D67|nr:class I SAM-dependent methyltransferase [Xanthomonas sp. 3307]MBB5941837.1 N-acetylglucosaminyldiphosphoundecaprenol N-acetyl-beta-D-mannosaminyltransferase [Xanthomonas sp. 3307]
MARPGRVPIELAADAGVCRCCGATTLQRVVWPEVYADTGQELRRCGHCALAYLAPDFTEDTLARFYAHDYRRLFPAESPWRSEARFFAWRGDRPIAQRRLQWIAPQLANGARLLEMGSGFGAFLGVAAAARPDLALWAIEPDLEHRARLLGDARVAFVPDPQTVADASVDAVVAFHVLEHLPDPRGFLHTLTRILAPGGHAWIEVPDVMGDWHSRNYVHPAHLSYFSGPVLQRLALSAGLEVVQCGAHPAGGVLADNLWVQLRRPPHPCATPLAGASAEEVRLLDARLDSVGWGLRDRLRRALKRVIVRAFGPGLPGEVQRWRGRRHVREATRDALR